MLALIAAMAAAADSAAVLQRDSVNCRRRANLDACYDAIRWAPGDPGLLISLGDALMRANRPGDAIRNYRRAAMLAPATRGLSAKINLAEAKAAGKNVPNVPNVHNVPNVPQVSRSVSNAAVVKRYSNSAPESQSH
jgi:hypothetical protein